MTEKQEKLLEMWEKFFRSKKQWKSLNDFLEKAQVDLDCDEEVIFELLKAQKAKDAHILMTCAGTLEDAENQILNQ